MPEPNFSESQLQNAVNTAYGRAAFDLHGTWIMARIPSLFAEFDLGWDSGFYMPWVPHAPSATDKGCNFFLQYKLSSSLLTSGAKEWNDWRSAYFRFKVPHSRQDPVTGKLVDDYHQWDRLKALANRGYPVFYATNWTVDESELDAAFTAGTLLDHLPSLDVRTVHARHKHVTFTDSSASFLLHSEPEETRKVPLSEALAALQDGPMVTIGSGTQSVIDTARELWSRNERLMGDLGRIESQQLDDGVPQRLRPWLKRARLASVLRRYYGLELHWRPQSYG